MNNLIYGLHAVEAYLDNSLEDILHAYCVDNIYSSWSGVRELSKHGIKLDILSKEQLTKLLKTDKHQGVALKVRPLLARTSKEVLNDVLSWLQTPKLARTILILDEVQDPHNLGACMRSAAGFQVDWIVTTKNNAVGVNATVQKVASGAEHLVKWAEVTNLPRFIRDLKNLGVWTYATLLTTDAVSLERVVFHAFSALVMGSEGNGIRPLVAKECDLTVKIPINKKLESLNISVAAGVCLYEIYRQRNLQ